MQKTALLFAGQGAQTVGMGQSFFDSSATARALFEKANALLEYNLTEICLHGPEGELTKTEHAQPGIYLVSWVAFGLLKEALPDFRFEAAAGLSLGEFTALAAAGAIGFEDGLKVVRQRGIFMQEACESSQGGMAAIIGLDEQPTREVCQESGATLANLNCPGQIVISGDKASIRKACELATARGARKAIPLNVAGAYHSPLMASAQPKLKAALAAVPIHFPAVPVISNVTAKPHGTPAEIHAKLVQQVTSSVLWETSVRYLIAEGFTRFIELGPGTALSGFMKRIDKQVQMLNVNDAATLQATVEAIGS